MEVRVRYWNEYATNGVRFEYAEFAVRRCKDKSSGIHETLSFANQRAFVTAKVARVEKVAPSGGNSLLEKPGEIVEPGVNVKNDDENWDLEGIMTLEEDKASGRRRKMCSLQ